MQQVIAAAIVAVLIASAAEAGERCAEIPAGAQTDRVVEACQLKRVELGIAPSHWNTRRCTLAMIRDSTRDTLDDGWRVKSQADFQTLRNELHTEVPAVADCGDGELDATIGETCDDGNVTNGDGCSEVCLTE